MRHSETAAFGGYGGEIIDDTLAHSNGKWAGVLALEDTVIATLVGTNVTQNSGALAPDNGSNTSSAVTLKAGIFLPGHFTAITLSSGGVYLPKIPDYSVPCAPVAVSSSP